MLRLTSHGAIAPWKHLLPPRNSSKSAPTLWPVPRKAMLAQNGIVKLMNGRIASFFRSGSILRSLCFVQFQGPFVAGIFLAQARRERSGLVGTAILPLQ